MSEFGIRIKNIEAATLYEYNKGLRGHYEYKDAMFVNSLFKDFICENGLKVWKEDSTRDLICLEFNFGTRSYSQEIEHLEKLRSKTIAEKDKLKQSDKRHLIEANENKLKKIDRLIEFANTHEGLYSKKNAEEIRTEYYKNGVDVEYVTKKKNGEIVKCEKIHYVMLYRSTGKAKKGTCTFIRDKLYKKAITFLRMGINLPDKNADIVGVSAYSSLICSGIVGKIKINPKNILVLEDIDRFFNTNVISVETDNQNHCIAKTLTDYKLKNTMFDGQALIDSSVFPDWGHGYVLLRHHFCKMAAFCTNIQLFFRDYFGDDYYSATVKDMWGNEHFVKDIELITTDNAMKWLKYDVSYEYWCNKVFDNNCMFGVVKTAHPSKLGNVQRMSYQMVNSLDVSIMEDVCKESIEYINRLKTDDAFFLEYLKKHSNFSNDYDVLIALYERNKNFIRSSYFRERKKAIIMAYILGFKSGRVIQNADNLVIVGSPYAMLLYSATANPEDVDNDDTFSVEARTIQCYTSRFSDNEYLAAFRSPFNGKYNLCYLHNVYNEKFNRYFKFCDQIIAVNMNGTDFQDRNNGSDQDSDSIYTTNQSSIVMYAEYCYRKYHTIVNNIPKDSNVYNNAPEHFARLDNRLAASQIDIGESSNLAQVAQTYDCTFPHEHYGDYVCILSVLAQVAIDSAKRLFDINVSYEIKRIKKELNVKENKYPLFWKIIHKKVKDEIINKDLKCPMNYLYNLQLYKFRSDESTIPITDFFLKCKTKVDRRMCKRVENMINEFSLDFYNHCSQKDCDYILLREDFDYLIDTLQKTSISKNYQDFMFWILDRVFMATPQIRSNEQNIMSRLRKNRSLIIKILYTTNPKTFLNCFIAP